MFLLTELELSVQAKALLLARDAGLELAGGDDPTAGLRNDYLLRSIGTTGRLALCQGARVMAVQR